MLKTVMSKLRPGGGDIKTLARGMIRRADAARDARRFREAATLYSEALRLVPGKVGIVVQLAHMLKECGDHGPAEERYLEAEALSPADADLALQLGHFYRSTGRIGLAETAYAKAARLKPGWETPSEELERLYRGGWQPTDAGQRATQAGADQQEEYAAASDFTKEATALEHADSVDRIVPELLPRRLEDVLHAHAQCVELRRLGRYERTHWGVLPTVRGIEALRGFCISATPILELQIYLNGQLVHRGPVRGGYVLKHEGENPDLRKYVFNVWFDFTGFVDGRYDIQFRLLDEKQRTTERGDQIVIARPFATETASSSDGFIPMLPDDGRSLSDRINALPSMVRDGRRAMLSHPPKTILVQRADQLGDLVVSVPAMRRLRELFPSARIIGLLSMANHELAATLDLFDEIIVIDFPEDRWEQRRIMPAEEQARLREKLAPYRIDIAIDLSESIWSRYLLLLTGAPFLFGFRGNGMPAMTVEIEGFTHDRIDNHEVVPHTNKQIGIVEWLGAMVRSETNIIRRDDIGWANLATFGLSEGDRYVAMHDGARLQFSRWPHYLKLATMLLDNTDLKVVMVTDDPQVRNVLPPELAGCDRFRLVDRRAAFDDFDALLSLCTVFVGNDSGPKHLASLRGTNVVSIHMARNNWNEWGQENGGFIVSRRVPCVGCLIHYDPEECGRDHICMTNIKPQEVYDAVVRLIGGGDRANVAPSPERANRATSALESK